MWAQENKPCQDRTPLAAALSLVLSIKIWTAHPPYVDFSQEPKQTVLTPEATQTITVLFPKVSMLCDGGVTPRLAVWFGIDL